MVHVRDMCTRGLCPLAHIVRVLASVFLDGARRAAVGVAFTQNGVYRTAQTLAVTGADFFFFFCFWLAREIRNVIAFLLQLCDAGFELRDRGTDVRQLDDIGVRALRQLTKFSQVVGDLLFFCQVLREFRQHARGDRDVRDIDVDTGCEGETFYDRKEGLGGEEGCFVSERVDNFWIFCRHSAS